MPSVQIKDVPDDTHAELRRRAALAQQSLQEYLRSWLIAETSRPSLDEVLDRSTDGLGGRTGAEASVAEVVRTLRADRAGR